MASLCGKSGERRVVLVAGAINTDFVVTMDRAPEAGETITGRSFAIHAGGKGANQAVAVARYGVRAAMLGGIGGDQFGRARLDDLRSENIDVTCVETLEHASSGIAAIFVEAHGDNRIAYVPGATGQVSPATALQAIAEVDPGLVLVTNELPLATLEALMREARRRRLPVVFNATPDPERAHSLLPLVDVLVVNEGEARALDVDPDGAASKASTPDFEAHVPAGLVITLGERGVVGRDSDRRFRHRAPQVPVVDTTAAGDALCGVLAAELLAGAPLADAAGIATVAGALAVTKAGAQPSIPRREEIERLLDRQALSPRNADA